MDLQVVCTAARLNIPRPAIVMATTKSHYEGKKLPHATRTAKKLLPVFPKLLEKVSASWKDRLFSEKGPIKQVTSLDIEGMEKLGICYMLLVELLVAADLHLWLSASSSISPTLP